MRRTEEHLFANVTWFDSLNLISTTINYNYLTDQQGNVNGQYTYVNTEGNLIQVKYSAGAEKGFVIENESELSEAVDKATQDGNVALQQEQQAAGGNRAKSIDT